MRKILVLLLITTGLLMGGCAGKGFVSPEFNAKAQHINRIGIIASDVRVQEVSIGGERQLLAKETEQANFFIENGSINYLASLNINSKSIPINHNLKPFTDSYNMIDKQELAKLVLDKNAKPVFVNFINAAESPDVDAYLLLRATENCASGGLNALKVVTLAKGGHAMAEKSTIDVSLVDKDGYLLYYNNIDIGRSIRNERDIRVMLSILLKKYAQNRKI